MSKDINPLLPHLQSANRRRKRAEKTLKRVRKESQASIKHWKESASMWQKKALDYAKKYQSRLDLTKHSDLEEGMRISAMLFPYDLQKAWMVHLPYGIIPHLTPPTSQGPYQDSLSQKEQKEQTIEDVEPKLFHAWSTGADVLFIRDGKTRTCKVNRFSISMSSITMGSPYDIDLIDCDDFRTHYPVTNINEIIFHKS